MDRNLFSRKSFLIEIFSPDFGEIFGENYFQNYFLKKLFLDRNFFSRNLILPENYFLDRNSFPEFWALEIRKGALWTNLTVNNYIYNSTNFLPNS